MLNDEIEISRKKYLAENIVIIDGYPGCGKTLFGPIVSALDRVELLNYAFEIEFICRLYNFNKITKDASESMIKMIVDDKLYQTMMGRGTNFRYSDLSSVFNDSDPLRYFKRIFQKGDEVIPKRIEKQRPILSLTTHNLLSYAKPIFNSLGKRLTFLEITRHPLYMIIQETKNMENLISKMDARDIQINFESHGIELPYFCYGWEDAFIKSNDVEKAIYSIHHSIEANKKSYKFIENSKSNFLTIPFEKFVINPNDYLKNIAKLLDTKITNKTIKALKKQNVPRKKVSDGIPLDIYKKCGWEPPIKGLSEQDELIKRRDWVEKMGVSVEAMKILDKLSLEYEEVNL